MRRIYFLEVVKHVVEEGSKKAIFPLIVGEPMS
jgi:hypothetical protein